MSVTVSGSYNPWLGSAVKKVPQAQASSEDHALFDAEAVDDSTSTTLPATGLSVFAGIKEYVLGLWETICDKFTPELDLSAEEELKNKIKVLTVEYNELEKKLQDSSTESWTKKGIWEVMNNIKAQITLYQSQLE